MITKHFPNGDAKIYESVKIADVVIALNAANIDILSINSADESVEDYYLNLVKERGGK